MRLSFQGIPHHRASTKAQEPSGIPLAVTHVFGLFCDASAKYAQELCPWLTQGAPLSSALRLCRPSLRSPFVALRERNPPPALAALAGMGQGQGVFENKHSTAIQNGGTTS